MYPIFFGHLEHYGNTRTRLVTSSLLDLLIAAKCNSNVHRIVLYKYHLSDSPTHLPLWTSAYFRLSQKPKFVFFFFKPSLRQGKPSKKKTTKFWTLSEKGEGVSTAAKLFIDEKYGHVYMLSRGLMNRSASD